MKCLWNGKIEKKDIKEAIKEVEIIKEKFQKLCVGEVVWDFEVRERPIPDEYKKFIIDNAYNFYITPNNKHLVDVLLRALVESVEGGLLDLLVTKEEDYQT
jgi:hypothetical protein